MRISDWSSDVCSSDLPLGLVGAVLELLHDVAFLLASSRLVGGRHLVGLVAPGLKVARNVEFGRVVAALGVGLDRSAERRVGKECVSTCRSRWSPSHSKKNKRKIVNIYI